MSATLALMDMYFGARRNFSALHGAKLHSYQDQRARRIVAHAVARSPFYARHYAHQDPLTDPRRWRTLPVTAAGHGEQRDGVATQAEWGQQAGEDHTYPPRHLGARCKEYAAMTGCAGGQAHRQAGQGWREVA